MSIDVAAIAKELSNEEIFALAASISKAASLTPAEYEAHLSDLLDEVQARSSRLVRLLVADLMTPGEFRSQMSQVLRRAFLDAYRFGVGSVEGTAILNQDDLDFIKAEVAGVNEFLKGFRQDISSGYTPMTPAQRSEVDGHFTVAERTQMYADAVRPLYYHGQLSRLDETAILRWYRDETKESCGPCVEMEAGNPYTKASLGHRVPGYPLCDGGSRCGCEIVVSPAS